MVEVGEVEDLEVGGGGARLGERAELVDDLRRRAREAVLAQLGQLAADRRGAAGELGLVLAAADHLGGGEIIEAGSRPSAAHASRTRSTAAATSAGAGTPR